MLFPIPLTLAMYVSLVYYIKVNVRDFFINLLSILGTVHFSASVWIGVLLLQQP